MSKWKNDHLNDMTTADLIEEMFLFYYEAKRRLRKNEPHLYERWKAGGFLVDEDIISDYPSLATILDELTEDDEPEE
jgi:hypothetical protein